MRGKTKRIITIILCAILVLAMILPLFAFDLGASSVASIAPAQTYTVVLNSSAEASSPLPPVSVDMNDDYLLPECDFTNPGNTFAGWFCANDGKIYTEGAVYRNTDRLPTVTFFASWKVETSSEDGASQPEAATSVSIEFVPGCVTAEDSVTPAAITVTAGGSFVLPKNTFTADGYKFFGWDVEGIIMLPGEEVVHVTKDLTIRAEWTQKTTSSQASTPQAVDEVHVRLLPGAGDVQGEECLLGPFVQGTNFVFSSELHSRFKYDGHEFAGWKVGGKTYYDGNYVTLEGDMIATAQWSKVAPVSSASASSASETVSAVIGTNSDGYTDPVTGISLDHGLNFGDKMRVKQYTDKSVTDVYTAMLLQSKYLIVGYNIYVSSDIAFTGGRLTIPVTLSEEDRKGAVVLYHVVDSAEVRLKKYTMDQFENKIVFDSSSGQPAVSWVDFTSDLPREFALSVGNGKYAEIYIFPGDTKQLELDVSYLSPFLICRADAKYPKNTANTISINLEWRDDEGNVNLFWPVAIALGIAAVCVIVVVVMRVRASDKKPAKKRDDDLSSGK